MDADETLLFKDEVCRIVGCDLEVLNDLKITGPKLPFAGTALYSRAFCYLWMQCGWLTSMKVDSVLIRKPTAQGEPMPY